MSKIKWKYYKDSKEWCEQAYSIDHVFRIKQLGKSFFILWRGHFTRIGTLKKLSSAKQVAELLRNG